MTFSSYSKSYVDSLFDHSLVLMNFDHNTVEIENRIQAFQWAILPCLYLFVDSICDFTDETVGDVCAIHLMQCIRNITSRHASRIQGQNLLIQLIDSGFPFGDQLR